MFSLFGFTPYNLLFTQIVLMPDSNLYPITDRLVPEKENLLGSKGAVFWLTGLSGSGKSTLAIELEKSSSKEETTI